MRDEPAFRRFVDEHGAQLLHAARLLTGDHHRGEDLVQNVLTKLYLKWDRIDDPLPYARRALVTTNVDAGRRRWLGERPTETLPELAADAAIAHVEDADGLRRMLRDLPAQERAVVVLRYYCDLSEQDTAVALGIPLGTVKSSAARALARLRVTGATL